MLKKKVTRKASQARRKGQQIYHRETMAVGKVEDWQEQQESNCKEKDSSPFSHYEFSLS
jgi:hypothetical protein